MYVADLRRAHADADVSLDLDEILEREGKDGPVQRALREHDDIFRQFPAV